MYKSQFFAFVFVALIATAGINSLGQIRFLDDHIAPGSEVEMHANILNKGENKINDVRLTVYIPELGFFQSFGEYDVKKNKPVGKMMHFNIEDDVEPDEYLVRVRTFTKGHWESRYRHIIIG